ncbi:MAG: ferredoxin [Alphaproteobacteria bacterium]|nr:MAG: ferredoxin [Alphaproteobacteria bacterium]
MIKINVTTRDGESRTIEANTGQSLMEALRNEDIEGIDAFCGGSCACATCHVYMDENWLGKLAEQEEDEGDLLDDSDVRKSNSRLSCQIKLTKVLDGIIVTIPPEE